MKTKHTIILLLVLLFPFTLQAKLEDNVLKDGVTIGPGDSYLFTLDTSSPVDLGVFVDESTSCDAACIYFKQVAASAFDYEIQSNAFTEFVPEAGKVKISFRNISAKPVGISIHQYIKHCDAEACALLNKMGIQAPLEFREGNGDHKRIRIAAIDSIKTSEDGSWSDVKGQTTFGEAFDVTFVWWLYDPRNEISCGRGSYIERYQKAMLKGGGPALIAGRLVHQQQRPVFISVDTCTSRSPASPRSGDDY